jgi:hypothetical protein
MLSLLAALLVTGMALAVVLVAVTFITKVAFKLIFLPLLAIVFVLKAIVVLAVAITFIAILIPIAIVIGLIMAPFAFAGAALA